MLVRCTACRHPRRTELDQLLVAGGSIRDTATKFGLSKTAVARHQKGHLSETVLRVARKLQQRGVGKVADRSESLCSRHTKLLTQAEELAEGAEETRDRMSALSVAH